MRIRCLFWILTASFVLVPSLAVANPVMYVPMQGLYACTSNAHSGAVYLMMDEDLNIVSMGRSEKEMTTKDPAVFGRVVVSWTHLIEKTNWNYTFNRVTGVLTYGPGNDVGLSQQDMCKKKE